MTIIIGLGANITGQWGPPCQALLVSLDELNRLGIKVKARSRLYLSTPLGGIAQPGFVNAAALVETARPPQALLAVLKRIEAAAGRRPGRRWGPRALDLDLLDYKGIVHNLPSHAHKWRRPRKWITLPHPGIAERPFVLRPIQDIAPRWRHPVLKTSAAALLRRAGRRSDGAVVAILDGPAEAAAAPQS